MFNATLKILLLFRAHIVKETKPYYEHYSTHLAFSPRMSIDSALLGTVRVFRLFGLIFRFTNCLACSDSKP
jgi:hypothetical protein